MSFYLSHPRVTLDCGAESITIQSAKDECDIHKILKQYQKTGIITHINRNSAQYLDLPNGLDYQQSLEIIREGSEAFASLPASVRERFNNSPMSFLYALNDPAQHDDLRALGVLKPVDPPVAAVAAVAKA